MLKTGVERLAQVVRRKRSTIAYKVAKQGQMFAYKVVLS
jgi:hypothetical protein